MESPQVRIIKYMFAQNNYKMNPNPNITDQELTYDHSHYYGTRRQEDDSHKHRDFAEEGGFLCPSEIKYAKPKRGKTAQGVWKDIVNVDDYTQTLRMEKCL